MLLKPVTPKKQTKGKASNDKEMAWDFDSKEHAREKYGNFNTPIIMKLCSKFNKQLGEGAPKLVAADVADIVEKALN